jgi:catechol 2,3-dioxygenase-like lactoylglutathione lyase family enzyme
MSHPILPSKVVQVGLIVSDIEKTAREYCRVFGCEMPQIMVTDGYEKSHSTYRGQPTHARAKLAFFNMGQLSIELIEPIGEPSTWKEHLDANGVSVHHLAFEIQDTPAVVSQLGEVGIAVVQQGDYTGGRYTYLDSTAQLGVAVELLENFDR